MPLPLGHAAVGLATCEVLKTDTGNHNWWKRFVFVLFLSNLPDVDVLVGLLASGNGWVFHRGPTHSLAFALLGGLIAARAWRFCSFFPRIGFFTGFTVVFSHVLIDMLRSAEPLASLFWPFEIAVAQGSIGWRETVGCVLFDAYQDWDLILASVLFICLLRWLKRHMMPIAYRFKPPRICQPE